MPGSLLQSWYEKNGSSDDYLPKLVQMGMSLRNDVARIEMQKQQLQNQYAQFQAEAARANQQAQFQDRKFAYSIQQDQMNQSRQNMLDARAGKYQDAQIANWTADNGRADSAEDFNKSYREAQMAKWRRDNEDDAPANFDWINGDTPSAGAPVESPPGGESYLPPDGAVTASDPQNFNTAGDGGLPSWGEQSSPDASLMSPASTADVPRAVPVAEPYAGSEGAVGAPGAQGQPSDPLAGHPGRAKAMALKRAKRMESMAYGLKGASRNEAMKQIAIASQYEDDPDVLDYNRRLNARVSADSQSFEQDQLDEGHERGYKTKAREASRQIKDIEHYAGADLPFGTTTGGEPNAYSPEMKNLRKGIPAANWQNVAAAEEKAQLNKEVDNELDWRDERDKYQKEHDTSIEGRVGKAVTKADSAAILESRQFNEIQTKWADENPDAMRVIEQAAIAAKAGGQPPSQEEILKQIDEAVAEPSTLSDRLGGYTANRPLKEVFSAPSFTAARSQYLHPNPDKRDASSLSAAEESAGMTTAQRLTGRTLANKDIALMIYNRMIATGPVVDSVEKYNALKSGESYRDEKGIPRVKK